MKDVLELETRRQIYDLITKNPGIHLSKVAKLLKMRTSLVDYHILFLEKHGLIISDKETGFKRHYVKGKIGLEDKQYLFILRQKTVLKIILYLLKSDYSKHKDILDNVDVSASTLSYHLNKLVKNDIIELSRYGDNKGYKIKNREELVSVLVQYKPYSLIDGFNDVWADLTI